MAQHKTGKVIQSVQRAVDIINCFEDITTERSLSELSTMLDLNKSTVHGILNTLHNNNFVRQNQRGKYMLGQALLRKYHFADSAKRSFLMEEAREDMTHLANAYRVSAGIFMLEFGELVLVNRILPEKEMYTITSISESYLNPLYCTASGKLLLSFLSSEELEKYIQRHEFIALSPKSITSREALLENLELIRSNGFSEENEELGLGVAAISAPILDAEGNLFGTVSVTGLTFHIDEHRPEIIFDLKTLTRKLSHKLFA